MINRKSIVNSPDDRLRQFNRMPIPSAEGPFTCSRPTPPSPVFSGAHSEPSASTAHSYLLHCSSKNKGLPLPFHSTPPEPGPVSLTQRWRERKKEKELERDRERKKDRKNKERN